MRMSQHRGRASNHSGLTSDAFLSSPAVSLGGARPKTGAASAALRRLAGSSLVADEQPRISVPPRKGSAVKLPPTWTEQELQHGRDVAEREYIVAQEGEGGWADLFNESQPVVEAAFEKTRDLRTLDAGLVADRELWQILRFCCGPPISEENLWTFIGKKFQGQLPVGLEAKTANELAKRLDPVRFPWVVRGRAPTKEERQVASTATATLITQARFTTLARGQVARRQTDLVYAALKTAGFVFDEGAKTVEDLRPGTYCGEKTLHNKKCDVPIRLNDGRLLSLECKVSNTPKNSWKRLNQETVGKSNTWRGRMHDQVVTGCVLAGVFDLQSLVQAQQQGIFIFWEHDLASLVAFVRR